MGMEKKAVFSALVIFLAVFLYGLCFAESFTKIVSDGFGNSDNRYAWSMSEFTPETGEDTGTKFLYVGTRNEQGDGAGELHRMNVETGVWQPVTTAGFANRANKGVRNLIVYETESGKGLYAGTFNLLFGAQMWRSFDGMKWRRISYAGFKQPVWANAGTRGAAVIGEHLYIGTSNDIWGLPVPPTLMRFKEVRGSLWINGLTLDVVDWEASWEYCIKNGDENHAPTNKAFANIFQFTDKNGVTLMYSTVWNALDGCKIYASETGDPGTWYPVMSNGFGHTSIAGILSVIEYKGYIYCGTGDNVRGCGLYRSNEPSNPDSWERISINPGLWEEIRPAITLPPELAEAVDAAEEVDGLGYGPISRYTWSMVEYNGSLYIATYNPPTDLLPGYFRGAFIYKSSDGVNWVQVLGPQAVAASDPMRVELSGGFNDVVNVGIRTTIVIDGKLYLGTATRPEDFEGQHGCEVWVMDQ